MTFERVGLMAYLGMRERGLTAAHRASLRTPEELEGMDARRELRVYLGRDVEGHGGLVATGYALRESALDGAGELVEVFSHGEGPHLGWTIEEAREDARRRGALRVVEGGEGG